MSEKPPRGDDLYSGHGERKGTRTSDDQDGDRDQDRVVKGCTGEEPSGKAEQGCQMNGRRVETRDAVGEAKIARAIAARTVQEALDLGEQRILPGRGHPHRQGACEVDIAAMDRVARRHGSWLRLAGHEGLVDFRMAIEHDAVGRNASAGPHEKAIARLQRGSRDRRGGSVGVKAICHVRLECSQIAGNGPRPASHGQVEIAAAQKKEEQRHGAVEIGMLGMARCLEDRCCERQQHTD